MIYFIQQNGRRQPGRGKNKMDWKQRKKERTEHFEKNVKGWKLRDCSACSGSGRYKNRSCGACSGTGKERYKNDT